jgi:TonB family protein
MRHIYTCCLVNLLCLAAAAQQNEFEGIIEYKVDIKSKAEGVSDKAWRTMLATDEKATVFIKHGNYLLRTGPGDQYFIPAKQRTYIRFKGIDTLYYLDYSSDTTSLLNVSKPAETRTIAGYSCKSILIKTSSSDKKYFYAPALYMNPEYDRNNTIGRLDVYTKETSSVWLASYEETQFYSISYESARLEAKKIDDTIFDLPKLPEKKFSTEELTQPPEFTRSGGWLKYISSNLKAELGAKYVKIPKGEKEATQTVMVSFIINENGRIVNVQVVNKKEVHPKLAEEAVRVISASPSWKPAAIYGQKTVYWYRQPVTFQVPKE